MAGESAAIFGRWQRRFSIGASLAARQRGFCRLVLGWTPWQGGVDGALVVAHWRGRGIVVALALAR